MARLILDTSALIALERHQRDENDVLPDDADVALSAATASELVVGVELADKAYHDRRRDATAFDQLPGVSYKLLA